MIDENERRKVVVDEALTWLRTPWHHRGRVKQKGVDCANFLAEVFSRVGLVPEMRLPAYPPDWHMHRDEPRFLAELEKYAVRVEDPPLPADIVMFKFGRHEAHGAIVVRWPTIVHAHLPDRMVVLSDVDRSEELLSRFAGTYRLRIFTHGG